MDKHIYNEVLNPQNESDNQRILIIKKERRNLKDNLFVKRGKSFLQNHWNEFKFTVLGLIIAILFITIGFWATILIVLLCAIGNVYGKFKDGDRRVFILFDKLFNRF